MRAFPTLICILLTLSVAAQQPKKRGKVYKVNPGQKVMDAIPRDVSCLYPSFRDGIVSFRNGNVGNSLMNYNALIGTVEFVDPKGDTLSIEDNTDFKWIAIGADTFYYSKNYIRQIASIPNLKLGVFDRLELSNRQKIGGFGEVSSASIQTFNSSSYGPFMRDLIAKEILAFTEYTTFYFGDRYNNFEPASRRTLISMYGNKQAEVEDYLKKNPVKFNDKDDLEKLLLFLSKL